MKASLVVFEVFFFFSSLILKAQVESGVQVFMHSIFTPCEIVDY